MQSMDASYKAPAVVDYGTLREWTGSHHLYIGKQIVAVAAALSVPGTTGPTGVTPGGGSPGDVKGATGGGFSASGVIHSIASSTPTKHPGDVLGATGGGLKGAGTTGVEPGSIVAAHGNGGGTGSGGGSLPFTGLPVVITASIGAGVASAGAWARWAARRGDRPNTPL
jgi:hypothetical protein